MVPVKLGGATTRGNRVAILARGALVIFLLLFSAAAIGAGSAPPGFLLNRLNGSVQPVTADGITTFRILPNDCSDVDYRRGDPEDDCMMGTTRSQIFHEKMAKLGETVEYSFDILVDPAFNYPGIFRKGLESLPFTPGAWDSDLRIASWEGPERKSFVFTVKLDSTKGLTFQGRECAPPTSFGTWVHFSMKIRWDYGNKGWVHVTCNDRTIYVEEGAASARQAVCHMFNECEPGVVHHSKSFNFTVGPVMSGNGDDWKETGQSGKFIEIDPAGLTVLMRNISQRKGIELYGAEEHAQVQRLQERLNELGCDVGTPDGVVGRKTREQARLCRSFPGAETPDELNVATLDTFVDLYSRADAAGLPAGTMPVPPPYVIHVASRNDDHPKGGDTIYSFNALIERPDKEMMPIDFILVGPFNRKTGVFTSLDVVLDHDIGERAVDGLGKCRNNRLEFREDDGSHVMTLRFIFVPKKNLYIINKLDCVLEVLPEKVAEQAAFLVDHFDELASTLVSEGSVAPIVNEDVRTFINRVAAGEITVGRTE